ncbi:hypothetical protein AB0932_35580 [Streptomyces sp. NPDC006682]|nr:hypothetical protein BCL80_11913 [Streptomyces avidinii]SNX81114.1 hypothetical protein SAMN05421860_11713 [Streptomyces microflavus]
MFRRVFVGALTVGLLALGVPAYSQSEPVNDRLSAPSNAEPERFPGGTAGAEKSNCAEAAARHKAAGSTGLYGCITEVSETEARQRSAATGAAAVPLPVNDCTGNENGSWWALRLSQCQIDPDVRYTLRDKDGTIVATALFAIAQQMDLSATSLEWTETDQLVMLEASPKLPALTATWTTKCAATCSPATTAVFSKQPVKVGQLLKKTYKVADVPTKKYDFLDVDYTLNFDAAGATEITPPSTWDAEVRCDDQLSVGNTSGCVVPWFTPTLNISRAQYGSSADMINWAQINLSGHWGLRSSGKPLHRLQSASEQKKNRQAICGTGKFTPDPAVEQDSCDEFPFAGTYESGALNGVDHGNACAQVTSVRKNSTGDLPFDWQNVTPIGTVTGNEKCVRGHIPGPLNSYAGGAYGNFVQTARLADNDGFWLKVTSS